MCTFISLYSQEKIADAIGPDPAASIENTMFRRTNDFLTHPVFNRYVKWYQLLAKNSKYLKLNFDVIKLVGKYFII